MASTAVTLPDDPDLLKAMLLAERAESERLRQIIKELQRHRFGRRAESLPEEQLQLGLEEAEQVEASGDGRHNSGTKRPGPDSSAVPHCVPLWRRSDASNSTHGLSSARDR